MNNNELKRTPKRRPRRQYRVEDPVALARIMQREVDTRFGGKASRAAAWVRRTLAVKRMLRSEASLSQSSMSRVLAGKVEYPQESTVLGLLALVSEENIDRFARCFHGAASEERLRAFRAYREARYHYRGIVGPESMASAIDVLIDGWWRDFPAEEERVGEVRRSWGHDDETVRLVLGRLAEPFCVAGNTGVIERRWCELSVEERRAYVKHAVSCAKILLSRESDDFRCQREYAVTGVDLAVLLYLNALEAAESERSSVPHEADQVAPPTSRDA